MNRRQFESPDAPYDLWWDQARLGQTYYQVEGLDGNTLDATAWFVLLYMPLWPVERVRLRRSGACWKPIGRQPRHAPSVLWLYLKAFILFPIVAAIPVLPFSKEFFPSTGLPKAAQIPGILLWIVALCVVLWKLLDLHETSFERATTGPGDLL